MVANITTDFLIFFQHLGLDDGSRNVWAMGPCLNAGFLSASIQTWGCWCRMFKSQFISRTAKCPAALRAAQGRRITDGLSQEHVQKWSHSQPHSWWKLMLFFLSCTWYLMTILGQCITWHMQRWFGLRSRYIARSTCQSFWLSIPGWDHHHWPDLISATQLQKADSETVPETC